VFTPYKNAWLKKVDAFYLKPYPVEAARAGAGAAARRPARPVPTLADIGFDPPTWPAEDCPPAARARSSCSPIFDRMDRYDATRDFPGRQGPELPERAPALWHGVGPPAGAHAMLAHAAGHAGARCG
jgi:deoxyribodipyrimidine photo-lyase